MNKLELIFSISNIRTSLDLWVIDVRKFYQNFLNNIFLSNEFFVTFQGANKYINGDRFVCQKNYLIHEKYNIDYMIYQDSMIEIKLPVSDFEDMKILPYKSEYTDNFKDVFNITFGNVSDSDMYKAKENVEKLQEKDNFFKIDIFQTGKNLFGFSLNIIIDEEFISKKIVKEWFFYFLKHYKYQQLSTDGVIRKYPNWNSAESVFLNRLAIDWFTFIPAEIFPEEVPSAHEIVYVPNWGSLIISTEEPYDFQNPEMRKIGAAIEKELYDLGLLPITASGHSPAIWEFPFISREQRLKNRVK